MLFAKFETGQFIERFYPRGQHLCKLMGTKQSVDVNKEYNSHWIGIEHQHGRRFIVLVHQYGRRDVMWNRSVCLRWYDFLDFES